ncbi:MAG TPA: multiheme c-type cytochrome [Acidobacteriota bacterium]|nr:multiheme c-type cytochrome [Acidobacteriota bacterium]
MRGSIILPILLLGTWVLIGVAGSSSSDDHAFVGNKKCYPCHLKQFKSWQETKMAKAYQLLKPGERSDAKKQAGLDPDKDYTGDAECLKCHVTGWGQPGGFVDMQQTPQLAGVGCESCHGAGSEYIKDPYMSLKNKEYKLAEVVAVGLVAPVTGSMCTSCHNEESPFFKAFDFEQRKEEGIHQVSPLRFKHE